MVLSEPMGLSERVGPPEAPGPTASSSAEPTQTTDVVLSEAPPAAGVGWKSRRWQHFSRFRWVVALLAALICASATYLASLFVPPTFESTVLLRVTTGATSTGSSDGVLAANQLAAQYSQLVLSSGVLERTAALTGETVSKLSGALSGSVQANQNIVTITATAGSATRADALSAAAGEALAEYVLSTLVDPGGDVMRAQLTELQESLAAARTDAVDASAVLLESEVTSPERTLGQLQYNAAASLISNLSSRERELRADLEIREAEQAVAVTPLGSPNGPQTTSPRPTLYALVAFVVTLLIAAHLISSSTRERRG